MTQASNLETEVKLRIPSTAEMEAPLRALGFRLAQPCAEERSTLWDRGRELVDQGSALRVRRYGSNATLTWKGPRLQDPLLKIRPEQETAVEDPDALERILRALGYSPILTMVKLRSMWKQQDMVACLDRTPFGCFLELEGEADAIRTMMASLGLGEDLVETRSYPTLFLEAGLASVEDPPTD